MNDIEDAWFTTGLPGAECERFATYCRRLTGQIPAVEAPVPSWTWVPQTPRPLDWSIGGTGPDKEQAFLAAAKRRGLSLPATFTDFVANPQLRDAIRSGTGCWWSVDGESIAVLPDLGLPVIRFLNDQQDVLFWYLLLDGTADPPVLVADRDLTSQDPDGPPPPDGIWRCASTFHEFMYRFWLENEIGFRTRDGEPLTAEQTYYLREAQRLLAAATRSVG